MSFFTNLPPWKRTLYVLFVAQLLTAVGFSSIYPFLPLYVDDLGSAAGLSIEFLAGAVFSAQALTMMLASPLWGSVADRYGRKLMVERAMFGGAFILLLMAFVRSAEELVLLRAIQGFITGTVAAANALVAAEAPREETGFAMGLLQVGMGTGIALGPLIGGAVADVYGYGAAFYVTAAMLFLAGIMVWLWVVESEQPQKRQGRPQLTKEWRGILSRPGITITYGMRFITQMANNMIIPIAPLFIQSLMSSSARINTWTGMVISVASITTTFSAIFLGRLGDRTGHRPILIVSALAAAALYLPQSLVNATWQLLMLQALAGLALGGIVPSLSALLATFSEHGKEGAVYGLDNSINAGGRSIAPMLGSSVAVWFGMRATFSAAALFFLMTALLAVWQLPQVHPLKEADYETK